MYPCKFSFLFKGLIEYFHINLTVVAAIGRYITDILTVSNDALVRIHPEFAYVPIRTDLSRASREKYPREDFAICRNAINRNNEELTSA